jgi:RND family efflux transporter MFP subunit
MTKSTPTAHVLRTLTGLVAAVALVGCSADAGIESTEAGYFHLARGSQLVAAAGFEVPREFAGLVAPRQSTELAFERAGELAEIRVDEGDTVAAGQVLAELDTRLLQSQKDDLLAQRLDLEAQLELNAANRQRADELLTRGFTADQRIDELETERRSLSARLDRLAAELDANSTRLEQSRLVAPFAGAISRRLADRGAVVSPGTPILTVLEDLGMEARVGVPVRMLDQIEVGKEYPVRIRGQRIPATVLAVGSDVTRATLTVPVRLALPEGHGTVAGDQAYLVVGEAIEEQGFWVPMEALTDGMRGLWNVYVMVPGSGTPSEPLYTLESRDVRVMWADEQRAFVRGAIAAGELLVDGGLHRLVPGQRVRLDTTAEQGG